MGLSKICLILTITLATTWALWDCPDPVAQNPCYCVDTDDLIDPVRAVHCEGATVTQDHINKFLTEVKKVNNMTHGSPVPDFYLRETRLTSLDMTVFHDTRFESFILWATMVTEISGAADINLSTPDLNMALNPKAFLDLLKIDKVSQTIENLHWDDPNMSPIFGTPEFASITSRLPNVKSVYFLDNNITHLSGVNLTPLSNLDIVTFAFNKMTSIGENALMLPDSGANPKIRVDLSSNELSNDQISPASGISTISTYPVNLGFEYNNFESISAENFQAFLDLNVNNYLNFRWNAFNCDCRMKWLKDGADRYQRQTNGLSCENDEGKTIFTTALLDDCPS